MNPASKFILMMFIVVAFFAMPLFAMAADNPIKIFVSILPQAYFVEQIGGQHVDVEVLVGKGMSPATFDPSPKQMVRLSKASIYFRVGVAFEEKLLGKISSLGNNIQIVDTRKGVKLLDIKSCDGTLSHHHQDGTDSHIWLDPKRVIIQAQTICHALCKLDPSNSEYYKSNLEKFVNDLEALDEKISSLLEKFKGRKILVFHPAYGYFADSYGLSQCAVEKSGKSPGPRQIASWIDLAKSENVRFIFVQPQFSSSSAKTIAKAVGATVIPLDPLAKDYLENLNNMAQIISKSLEQGG